MQVQQSLIKQFKYFFQVNKTQYFVFSLQLSVCLQALFIACFLEFAPETDLLISS